MSQPTRCSKSVSWRLLGGACMIIALALAGIPTLKAAPAKRANTLSIKGTCTWGNTKSTWTATLTPKGKDTYDAAYVAIWGGKPLDYAGTITSDFKTEISGTGKGKNGNFEFKGKFGDDAIAKCNYSEIGGHRKGAMTAEAPE